MEAGIYPLTAENYHADPCPRASLSSSIAKILIEQSPAHAWLAHPRLNPDFKREAESRADLGSAAHAMLLENRPDVIVVVDADDWRTKAAKEARDAAAAQGKFAILASKMRDVMHMVGAAKDFMADTELAGIFETGIAEQSVLWQEGELWCRCRPDLMSQDKRIVVDYKTTSDASPEAFSKQIARMAYDLQSSWYSRGVSAVTGTDTIFVLLVQEITAPYACSLISLSNAYKAVGDAKVKRALTLWERAMKTQNWPGYSNQILFCEPRPWELVQIDEEAS